MSPILVPVFTLSKKHSSAWASTLNRFYIFLAKHSNLKN
jgi:hypothetical protein